jgi:hypothetical protein
LAYGWRLRRPTGRSKQRVHRARMKRSRRSTIQASPATIRNSSTPSRDRATRGARRRGLDIAGGQGVRCRDVTDRRAAEPGSAADGGLVTAFRNRRISQACCLATGWSDPVAGWESHPPKTNTFPRCISGTSHFPFF